MAPTGVRSLPSCAALSVLSHWGGTVVSGACGMGFKVLVPGSGRRDLCLCFWHVGAWRRNAARGHRAGI